MTRKTKFKPEVFLVPHYTSPLRGHYYILKNIKTESTGISSVEVHRFLRGRGVGGSKYWHDCTNVKHGLPARLLQGR